MNVFFLVVRTTFKMHPIYNLYTTKNKPFILSSVRLWLNVLIADIRFNCNCKNYMLEYEQYAEISNFLGGQWKCVSCLYDVKSKRV